MTLVIGSPSEKRLQGSWDNDLIIALGGPVTIIGEAGSDVILASRAGDLIHGDGVTGPLPWEEPGPGNNLIFAGGGDDTVYAGFGADWVWGGNGDDLIFGHGMGRPGSGSDVERALRLDGADWLYGGAGNDTIDGGGGDDTIHGGKGDDRLSGGFGADALSGGSRADVFVFGRGGPASDFAPHTATRETGTPDMILDFEQGVDRIDVAGLGHSHMPWIPMLFRYQEEFIHSIDPQVRYEWLDDGTTLVQIFSLVGRPPPDLVPPPRAAAEIVLAGHVALTEQDFVL